MSHLLRPRRRAKAGTLWRCSVEGKKWAWLSNRYKAFTQGRSRCSLRNVREGRGARTRTASRRTIGFKKQTCGSEHICTRTQPYRRRRRGKKRKGIPAPEDARWHVMSYTELALVKECLCQNTWTENDVGAGKNAITLFTLTRSCLLHRPWARLCLLSLSFSIYRLV